MPPKKHDTLGRSTSRAVRAKQKRARETSEERQRNLEANRNRSTSLRENETEEEYEERLLSKRKRSASERANESEEQRAYRLESSRQSTSRSRSVETEEEREHRLNDQLQRTTSSRNRETEEQRRNRQRNDQQRITERAIAQRNSSNLCLAAFNYDPQIQYSEHRDVTIGAMDQICKFCRAKKFKKEPAGMCCNSGKVKLPPLESPPDELERLMTGETLQSKHFLTNIRRYNSCFQMTSFGTSSPVRQPFIPTTFKIQGQIYHKIGALLPTAESSPRFLQIYFMGDEDSQIGQRCELNQSVRSEIVSILQRVLDENNILIREFRTAMERMPEDTETEKFRLIIKADKRPPNEHERRFNAPTVNEAAVVISNQEGDSRDIVLFRRNNTLTRIAETHQSYDALQYPIMFPRGEDGYHFQIPQINPATGEPLTPPKKVSSMAFYAYRIMIRDGEQNHLLRCRQLFNQFIVDCYAKIEGERLLYIRLNQETLRKEDYIHLRDAVMNDGNLQNMGTLCILPSSFMGSPRQMHEYTQDAMTYVKHYGTPDLFITFTCNPAWQEIKAYLCDGQNPSDRQDIISTVFHQKQMKLISAISKYRIFGEVRCWMYTIEYQKRGLPHSHNLFWLKERIPPSKIDEIISAELPNKEVDPVLHEIVLKNMVHGPCGGLNPRSPCMKDNKCTKRYPRQLLKDTQTGEDGYPKYRRRSVQDGGFTAKLNRGNTDIEINNQWIVPYCPLLSKMFMAHINVEYCNSVKSIKYVCKYINKGTDLAMFGFSTERTLDEIQQYQLGRYICSSESIWRILGFHIHERFPTVLKLHVHLENGQRVYYTPANVRQRSLEPPRTTLTAFFEICQSDDFARTLLYVEVPRYYTWDRSKKRFLRRKQGTPVPGHDIFATEALGRVYTVHPNQAECFYLRLLLHSVRGPTSFAALRTVEGVLCETYREACQRLGLLEDDQQWDRTMTETRLTSSPAQLRNLFAIILINCNPSNPQNLWEKFKEGMTEDLLMQARRQTLIPELPFSPHMFNNALIMLEDICIQMGNKTLDKLGLRSPVRDHENSLDAEYVRELSYDSETLRLHIEESQPLLNADQRAAYNTIMEKVFNQQSGIIFLDAPGGTGKTFLTNLILAEIRCKGEIALAMASSGIAATLIHGGRTAHAALRLPLDIARQEHPVCNISKRSGQARVLQSCKLIVWDECTMAHKKSLEALHRTLQDLRGNSYLMGGVPILLCGDFRQTLPVIPRATPADEINACLKSSPFWRNVQTIHLRKNMRVTVQGPVAETFAKNLLAIGEGRLPTTSDGDISLTSSVCTLVESQSDLIARVYPDIMTNYVNQNWLRERAILAARNEDVDIINLRLLEAIPGNFVDYKSIDTTVEVDDAVNYPVEFLNSQNPPGLPPHLLRLKVGCPIMLLRNLQPPKLCNGTRLCVQALFTHSLQAIILTGIGKGEVVYIPRIPLVPSDLPFNFKRLQLPVRPAYSMTINKSQGQSIPYCGISLASRCFSHGQLYVAFSRVGSPNNLFVYAPEGKTRNIVYTEVL